MSETILHALAKVGQSIWVDNINRPMLESGELKSLIDQGLRGMTSNPSIFQKAISNSTDYDQEIIRLSEEGKTTFEIYDELTVKDIQEACDQFKGVWDQTNGLDGYVSLEINPKIADTIEEQTNEGVRLAKKVDRPNLLVKVPATQSGYQVFEKLTAQGISCNVTLIFSNEQYKQVVNAYFKGLNQLKDSGGDVSKIQSVASVFVSRIDGVVDGKLEKDSELAGKAAVANCEVIYDQWQALFNTEEFNELKAAGANVQRVLWASTSTKNPEYSDVKYVEELIADATVNTIPDNTLKAMLDHGKAEVALPDDVAQAQLIVGQLKEKDIDLDEVCADLLTAGVEAFSTSFDELMASIEEKAKVLAEKSA